MIEKISAYAVIGLLVGFLVYCQVDDLIKYFRSKKHER